MKNLRALSYDESITSFFNYCKRHGIKRRRVLKANRKEAEPIMEFYKGGKSVEIQIDTLRGFYMPLLGPCGHLQLMKEMIRKIE